MFGVFTSGASGIPDIVAMETGRAVEGGVGVVGWSGVCPTI